MGIHNVQPKLITFPALECCTLVAPFSSLFSKAIPVSMSILLAECAEYKPLFPLLFEAARFIRTESQSTAALGYQVHSHMRGITTFEKCDGILDERVHVVANEDLRRKVIDPELFERLVSSEEPITCFNQIRT